MRSFMNRLVLCAALMVAIPLGASALAQDIPLDMSSVVNRAMIDETPGDGKGGWSDQGPENSLQRLAPGKHIFRQIQMTLLDAQANQGRSVVVFNNPQTPTQVHQIELPVAKSVKTEQVKYLYLLHTSCWGSKTQGVQGTIQLIFDAGRPLTHQVTMGRDLADWWNASDLSNAAVVHEENNGSSIVGVYLSKFAVPSDRGRLTSVQIRNQANAVWIVLAATLSDRNVPLEGGRWVGQANDQWKPVELNESLLRIKPGTALDFSFLQDAPAGKHGFVHVNSKGRLAFENRPDIDVRFLTNCEALVNNKIFAQPELYETYAQQIARAGYNCVRFQGLDAMLLDNAAEDAQLNPMWLDRWDRLASELKKQGVYLYLDMGTYSMFLKANGWSKEGKAIRRLSRINWDPAIREVYRQGVDRLLNHVNPYTGLALKDDPQLAIIQLRNESSLLFVLSAEQREKLDPDPGFYVAWRNWLKQKHQTTLALRAAWKNAQGDSALKENETLENLARVPAFWSNGPDTADFHSFVIDLERDTFRFLRQAVRQAGARQICTDFSISVSYSNMLVRDLLPVVDNHAYHEHPTEFMSAGSRQPSKSSLDPSFPGGYLRQLVGSRHLGRPFIVSETGQPSWNPWRYEYGLLGTSYAAFQDWQLLTHFVHAVTLDLSDPRRNLLSCFYIALDPAAKASERMAALFYRRGDVTASPNHTLMKIDPAAVKSGKLPAYTAVPNDYTALSFLTQFGVGLSQSLPEAAPTVQTHPKLVIEPQGGNRVLDVMGAQNVQATGGNASRIDAWVSQLRQQGVLKPGNRTDPARGIYQSDTEQLLIDTHLRQVQIVTPKSQGVSLIENAPTVKLTNLTVTNCGGPCAVFVGSLDGRDLGESSRMLLIAVADAVNTGMTFRDQRHQVLESPGKLPVLARVVKLDLRLSHRQADQLEVWALAYDGTRRGRVPGQVNQGQGAERAGGGELVISLDTARLPLEVQGTTPYFEIVIKQP